MGRSSLGPPHRFLILVSVPSSNKAGSQQALGLYLRVHQDLLVNHEYCSVSMHDLAYQVRDMAGFFLSRVGTYAWDADVSAHPFCEIYSYKLTLAGLSHYKVYVE